MEKVCKHCHRKFDATHKTRKYCSQACYWCTLGTKYETSENSQFWTNAFFITVLFLFFLVIVLVGSEVVKSIF